MAGNKSSEPTNPSGQNKNTESAAAMSDALKKAKESAESLTSSFAAQLKVAEQLRDAIAKMSESMKSVASTSSQSGSMMSPQTWTEVEKEVKKTEKSSVALKGTMQKLGDYLKKGFPAAAGAASKAVELLGQGFRNFFALIKGAGGLISTALGAVFDLAKAIVNIPLRIISNLFEMSKKPGDTALAQAIEDVRREFGSLRSESSSTVLSVAKGMGKLDSTGVSAYSVFGNLTERIQAVMKLAQGMGPAFQVFGDEIAKNGEAIMRYNKGLGITDEQMAGIASTALRMGKDIAEVQNEMTKQALGMSKAFGVNAKVISKDMAKAMNDLAHFGHLSTKEMAVAATFANKLGVSVDKLTGILDATKTYDSTAEQVSRLNEQFNLNIDAQQLMLAENPADQMAILRNEFSRAGVDISKLNRFQRDLIKSTGFMDDTMLNASLSAKNAGVSLDKMHTQGDRNEKSIMTQTEAMRALADSMERLIKQGETTKGGILDHLLEGFSRGIQSSPEFIKLMNNMRAVLQEALQAGVKLGKKFVELFPGIKDIFGGLADLFDPTRWKNMFDRVIKAFDVFQVGGVEKFDEFMEDIRKIFLDFFNQSTPAGKQVLEGFKKFGDALFRIFGKISEWIIVKLSEIVVDITKWLSEPKIPGDVKGLTKSIAGPFDKAFELLKKKLLPALGDLLLVVGKSLMSLAKQYLYPYLPEIGLAVGAYIFGPLFFQGMKSAIGAGFGELTKFLFKKVFGTSEEVKKAVETVQKAPDASGAGVGDKMLSEGDTKKAAEAGKASEQANKVNWGKVAAFLVTFAGVLLIGMGAVFAAIYFIRKYKITPIEMAEALAGVLAVAIAALPIAAALWLVSKVPKKDILIGAATIGAMMVIMIGALAAVVALAYAAGGADNLAKAASSLLIMEGVFLAAVVLGAAAAGVGALMAGPQGAFIALAIVSGLGTLGAVIAAMATTIVSIMKTLNEMTVQKDFKEKIDAFVKIMDSITNFAKNLADILKAVRPSLVQVIFRGDDTVKRIEAVTEMIKSLIGKPGAADGMGGEGIMGLMRMIVHSIKGLMKDNPHVVEGAKAFAAVLTAVGSLAAALKPSDKFYEAAAAVADSKNSEKALKVISDAMKNNGEAIQKIMKDFDTYIAPLIKKDYTADSAAAAASLAQTISSLAELSKSLQPSAEALNAVLGETGKASEKSEGVISTTVEYVKKADSFMSKAAGKLWSGVKFAAEGIATVSTGGSYLLAKAAVTTVADAATKSSKSAEVVQKEAEGAAKKIESLGTAQSQMASGLSSVVEKFGPSMQTMMTSFKGLQLDQSTVEGIKAILPLIKTLSDLTTTIIVQAGVTMRSAPKGDQKETLRVFSVLVGPMIKGIFTTISEGLPDIMRSIKNVIMSIPASEIEQLKKGQEVFKLSLEMLMGTLSTATQFLDIKKNNPDIDKIAQTDPKNNPALDMLHKVADFMVLMTNARGGSDGANSPFDKIEESIVVLSKIKLPKEGFENFKTLSEFINATLDFARKAPSSPVNFSGITTYLTDLLGPPGEANFIGPIDIIANLINEKKEVIKGLAQAGSTINSLKDSFLSLSGLAQAGDNLTSAAAGIEKRGIIPAMQAVGSMIDRANELHSLLHQGIASIKFDAKLKALANNIGMGGTFDYKVRTHDVLVKLDLNILIDAKELEKSIIFRKGSLIRDRLNFALGANGGKDDKTMAGSGALLMNEQNPTIQATTMD